MTNVGNGRKKGGSLVMDSVCFYGPVCNKHTVLFSVCPSLNVHLRKVPK